jgi:tetratricopeptide (TPR) repeat protein
MFLNAKHEKADQLLKKGELQKALELFNELIEELGENPILYSDRGVVFLHLNQREECLNDLSKAVQLQPDYSYRYACRAFAYSHFKLLDEAIVDYQKAVELDPEDAVAHNNLGMLLEQKGYKDEADRRFAVADKLAKAEDRLQEMMTELEQGNSSDKSSEPENSMHEDEAELTAEDTSAGHEFKKIFTSKKQFKEFVQFIKNGFKR